VCRSQLPVWQSLFEEHPNLDARLLAVALDAVRERVIELPEAQGAGFPILIDAENTLGEAYGFTAVPNAFVVGADGRVRYARYGFSIERDPDRSELLAALAGEEVLAVTSASPPNPEGNRLFGEGRKALERGDREEALGLWRRALELDPDNWIVRKQIWAVEHPELFYPAIDTGWQKEQLIREGYAR
jgi:tetratricopeptide (TPR) repeat protein